MGKRLKKPKPLPDTVTMTMPITFQVPVTLKTKGMTVKDLARTAFMLGMQLDFQVTKIRKRR